MARSGGTLISRCIGCMDGIALLSEIHPMGAQVHNPLQQAHEWFQLFSEDDIKTLSTRPFSYIEAIELIHQRAVAVGKTLVIRDWSHIDFTGVPFVATPPLRTMATPLLSERFSVISSATVRHPIDQWLSLSRLSMFKDQPGLTIEGYMRGYLAFARLAKQVGFIRYEDFTDDSDVALKSLCERLQLGFDPDYKTKWPAYTTITGDNTTPSESRFVHHTTIESSPPKEIDDALFERFTTQPGYAEAIGLLGYPPYWTR